MRRPYLDSEVLSVRTCNFPLNLPALVEPEIPLGSDSGLKVHATGREQLATSDRSRVW